MSTLLTSTRRRGRSWNFRKPSRLARNVTSSSTPDGHVAEMGRRHVLVHHRLEIEDIKSLLRAGYQMIVVARRPDERIGRPFRVRLRSEGRKAGPGEQRARGEKLDEAAAARELSCGQWHGGPSRIFCRTSYRAASPMETGAGCNPRAETAIICGKTGGSSPCQTASRQFPSSASAKQARLSPPDCARPASNTCRRGISYFCKARVKNSGRPLRRSTCAARGRPRTPSAKPT